jgi:hypothetical protein
MSIDQYFSAETKADAEAEHSQDYIAQRMMITQEALAEPVRVIADVHNHKNGAGHVWRGIDFQVAFPSAEEGSTDDQAEVVVPDYPLDEDYAVYVSDLAEQMVKPASVQLDAVNTARDFDRSQVGPYDRVTKQFHLTLDEVTARLAVNPDPAEESPAVSAYVPSTFTAAFEVKS